MTRNAWSGAICMSQESTNMDHSTYADIEIKIDWKSGQASHSERHYFQTINFWRDFFPGMLGEKLINVTDGDWVSESVDASELVPTHSKSNIVTLPLSRIIPIGKPKRRITPYRGRFYPRRMIAGSANVTSEEFLPLRVIEITDDAFTVDLNHPLASKSLDISLRVDGQRYTGKEERGGRCNDVAYETMISGIGLQIPLEAGTDFYAQGAFDRIDEQEDAIFYSTDRLINHIDQLASRTIADTYRQYLSAGDKVLDLMSSMESHLPDIQLDVTGLGMNENEMNANPKLNRHVIHDLNQLSKLPFEDNAFDTTMCNLSIEYLTHPLEVMQEMVRVTRPGGNILVSFSDRWFPPKAIVIWQELHPFERLGMALDYFLKTPGLENIHTESIRGQLRPQDDKYANQLLYSDPVFIVSANPVSND